MTSHFVIGLVVPRSEISVWTLPLRSLSDDLIVVDAEYARRTFPMVGAWVVPLLHEPTNLPPWLRRLSSPILLVTDHVGAMKHAVQQFCQPVVIMSRDDELERGLSTLRTLQGGQIVLTRAPHSIRRLAWEVPKLE